MVEVKKHEMIAHIWSMFAIKTGAVILGIVTIIYILFFIGR